jgi:hypothetical protein
MRAARCARRPELDGWRGELEEAADELVEDGRNYLEKCVEEDGGESEIE